MTEAGIMTIGEKAEAAIIEGDLSRLTPGERVAYYNRVCDALGLLGTTKPFGYIVLNKKLTLYAMKGCTDQLRKIHGVSLTINSIVIEDGICVVSVSATDTTGRTDTDIGAVPCGHLKGEDLANAKMRAMTKAKRRVTLSLCGLGFLDESEVASIPGALPDLSPGPLLFVPQPPNQDDLVTAESLKKIHAVAYAIRDKLPPGWREEMKARFGVESAKSLTEKQAGIILGELEMMQNGA